MANRNLKRPSYSFEQDTVSIYGKFTVGATGAVTAGTVKGGGLSGVVRNGAGDYTITLSDKYNRFLNFEAWFASASGNSGIARVEPYNSTPANFQSGFAGGAFSVKCLDYAGAAADPASGAIFHFRVVVRNSSIAPYGF